MKIENWTARQWHWLLLVGIVALVVIYTTDLIIGRPLWIVTRSFHLGYESNISTWYSSGVLFAAGVYAFLCYRSAALRQIKPRWGWLLASFFMICLSCDEVACLHEQVGGIADTRMPALSQIFPHTIWPIVLGPVVLVVVVAMAWILYSHMNGAFKAGVFIVLGVTVFLGSALLLEMVMNLLDRNVNQWLWDTQMIVEEAGEMLGAWLLGLGLILRNERYAAQTSDTQVPVHSAGQGDSDAVLV